MEKGFCRSHGKSPGLVWKPLWSILPKQWGSFTLWWNGFDLTGGTNTQKLAEGLNKALADQQGGVLQIQAQTDLRHAETVQQLQALLQEGEKKQREEALKLQAFLSEGEQRRQTQLEGGFTQIAQVAAGLREQNLLFQQQTQQALENVSRKILEVENLAREASTRVPALHAEHLAHMPDPAAHAAWEVFPRKW